MKLLFKLKSHRRGFTLIELLVVIAIISLLSSVVLASLRDARQKAQNAKLSTEIKQLEIALKLYEDDYGKYPFEDEGKTFCSTDCSDGTVQNELGGQLVPKYIASFPDVPNDFKYTTKSSYLFFYDSEDSSYSDGFLCDGKVPKRYLSWLYSPQQKLNLPKGVYGYSGDFQATFTFPSPHAGFYCIGE